ncbi:cyclin-dependent kinase inhibitor 3 family protein [Stenotrophomonas pavanii]|uniref:cyclin-dependent kinase inhibitor 3 family protein n=1 Tax=Stenotrophomonas pavanii TaxID=487698 RepID=UPI002DBC8322|nr:cyclin-dependent kinase inhibitor 3 family protein [Stenotrophomonas pavanii]MEC4338611.1 cyclin-dependent kinase inhibitor 3 family protein [Stenotrophomonas pavanii]
MMRTSLTHPLVIAELPIGARGGAVGVTFAPGKYQEVAMTGAWARDLDMDISAIRHWGAKHLISLLEPWEFKELGIDSLPKVAAEQGISWHGLPITDGAAPDDRLLQQWPQLSLELVDDLLGGKRVVVHCKGGLGRAGTVAAMLLLQTGKASKATDAIGMVRSARPGAVETKAQEEFLEHWVYCLRQPHR